MAVLDDGGNIVCDADVSLSIKDPSGSTTVLSTSNGEISVSDECEFLGVTDLPDYYTTYSVGGVGNYSLELTAITENGIRTINDNIIVQNSVPFDVQRDGHTRIFPMVPYVMNLIVTANEQYSGKITEFVPSDFEITPQSGLSINTVGNQKQLSWSVSLEQGQSITLSYEYDAPDVSPELFLLGPLEIGEFVESRQWQIASDAVVAIEIGESMTLVSGAYSAADSAGTDNTTCFIDNPNIIVGCAKIGKGDVVAKIRQTGVDPSTLTALTIEITASKAKCQGCFPADLAIMAYNSSTTVTTTAQVTQTITSNTNLGLFTINLGSAFINELVDLDATAGFEYAIRISIYQYTALEWEISDANIEDPIG